MTPEELMELANNTQLVVVRDQDCDFELGQVIYRHRREFGDDLHSSWCTAEPNGRGEQEFMMANEVELYVEPRVSGEVGTSNIARPVLEERKIGKIAIELFDEGFPNAIMAVSEVMTWAAEYKGYKPHDWKNLPQAETAFLAAGSRHRVKRHIQTAEGLSPIERVDDESHLLHLAHEAFNVLAQLELTITGRIQ
jgi:hypothetical protein